LSINQIYILTFDLTADSPKPIAKQLQKINKGLGVWLQRVGGTTQSRATNHIKKEHHQMNYSKFEQF
jgi:hypothetical protein